MGDGISIQPLTQAFGAEISGVDLTKLTPDLVSEIGSALDTFSTLLFRGQELTDRALADLARRFGEPYVPPDPKKAKTLGPDFPEIYVVSNVKGPNGKPVGGLGAGEAIWHSDISYLESPPETSFLYAVEVPEEGGDTWICSMAAALESMPGELRRRIDGRYTKHDAIYTAGGSLRIGAEACDDPRRGAGTLHPAICAHPRTGRQFLYLGRRHNAYVDGLTLDESEALLDELWAHATRPGHVYAHKWTARDLLVWDNRATLHRRDAFDPETRRLMHHVRLQGKERPQPVASPARPSPA